MIVVDQFSTQKNSITIECEKYRYSPGEQVQGKVLLNIVSSLEVQDIQLKLTGSEKVEWQKISESRDHEGNTTTSRDGPYSGRHDFLELMSPLGRNMALTIGQFEFPFSIQLPDALPESCEVGTNPKVLNKQMRKYSTRHWGSCRYKLKAVIQAGPSNKRSMKCTQVFRIVNLPPPTNEAVISETQEVGGCCASPGSVEILLKAEKNAYIKGDTIRAVAKVENDSLNCIKNVDLKFVQVIELTAHKRNKARVFEEFFPLDKCEKSGCPPRAKFVARIREYNVDLRVPYDAATSSCIGRIMKVYYLLRLRGKISLASTLKAEIPIVIYDSELKPVSTGWKPQVMPMLTVSSIPGYNPVVPNSTTRTTTNHAIDYDESENLVPYSKILP